MNPAHTGPHCAHFEIFLEISLMDMKRDLAIVSHVGHLRTPLEFVTNVKRQNSVKRNVTFRKFTNVTMLSHL